ncbi:hypothetical protein JSHR31_00880 [Helicobacter pylori]|nr:hypothetical protein JSHR31_00880 [Helicobacter pylori]
MDTRARCGGFKIEAISHLYGLYVLGVLLACFYLLDAYYLMLERLFREQ